MTKKTPTEYLADLGSASMDEERRARMRTSLSEYADFHAVTDAVTMSTDGRSSSYMQPTSAWSRLLALRTQKRTMYLNAALLIALMVSTGGTAAAAQGAVPGDALYPVKIHVNENVRSAFAFGANAEARLQADLLKERIEEAEKMAADGELEGEAGANAEARIIAQAETANRAAAEADAETQTSIRADLATSLATAALTSEAADDAGEARTAASGRLQATVDTALGILAGADQNTDTATMLAGEIKLETRVDAAAEREETLRTTISGEADFAADARARFMAQLDDARERIAEARAHLAAEARAAAEASVNAADEILGSIEATLSTMGDIEIDTNTGAIIDIDLNGNSGGGVDANSGASVDADSNSSASLDSTVTDVESSARSSTNSSGRVDLGL